MEYKLEDLVDIPLLQNLQEKLNDIYCFPSAIIDLDGKILTAVAWQDICTKFHRVHPQCEKECIKSDQYIADHLHEANPAVSYQCPHGLIDNATPIIIEGKLMGTFFTGQFFLQEPDLDFFKTQAAKYGFDQGEYLEAVKKVPVWTRDKLSVYLDFIKGFIEIIVGIGLKQLKEIEANRAIREMGERNRAILQSTFDWIWELDAEGRYCYCSENVEKILGYTPEEILGMSPFELMISGEQERVRAVFERIARENGSIINLENWNQHKDGHPVCLLTNGFPIFDESGRLSGYRGADKDITDRKNSEEELRKSYQIIGEIINTIPARIFWKDKDLKYLGCNALLAQDAGFSEPAELIGKDDYQMGWSEQAELYRADDIQVITSGQSKLNIEEQQTATDGSIKTILTSKAPLYNSQGEIYGVLGMYSDITERKSMEGKVIESESRLREVLENSTEVSYKRNLLTNVYEYLSPVFYRMTGYTQDEINSLPLEEVVKMMHPDDLPHITDVLNAAFAGEEGLNHQMDYRFQHKVNGEYRWLRDSFTVMRDEQGQPVALIGSVSDITERKKADILLSEAKEKAEESDRLKSAFLANMSHEIRTPMNGILGFAELLKEPNLTGKQQEQYIRIIEKSGARMLNIINDIMDISKIESGQMELCLGLVNVNKELVFVYNFFKPEADAKGIQLFFKNGLRSKEANIITDGQKVGAILTNLVKNALKYTNSGKIEFGYHLVDSTHESSPGKDTIHESYLRFFVKDTGIGIHAERQHAIFERFIQADIADVEARQGAGLGLAIAKSYAEMLGGRIWVESTPGEGSTFFFTISYQRGKEEEGHEQQYFMEEQSRVLEETAAPGLKILLVEDDETSVALATILLRALSREILIAQTGFQSLEICRNHPDIDLILMDIQMPEMNGYEATLQIRSFNQKVVVIAQTAFVLAGDREKALAAGCDDYISKPINKNDLLNLIDKYFGHIL